MNITLLKAPFQHVIVDGAISQVSALKLFSKVNEIPEDSIDFYRGEESQDNMQLSNNAAGIVPIVPDVDKELHLVIEKVSKLFDEYDAENYRWTQAYTETNRAHGNFLTPHTDDPEELIKRKLVNVNGPLPATLKSVFYIANPSINYLHYGTKLYTGPDRDDFIKEVEFRPCRLLIFKTSPYSYHGTDFIHGLPSRRFFITSEYIPKNAEMLYNTHSDNVFT